MDVEQVVVTSVSRCSTQIFVPEWVSVFYVDGPQIVCLKATIHANCDDPTKVTDDHRRSEVGKWVPNRHQMHTVMKICRLKCIVKVERSSVKGLRCHRADEALGGLSLLQSRVQTIRKGVINSIAATVPLRDELDMVVSGSLLRRASCWLSGLDEDIIEEYCLSGSSKLGLISTMLFKFAASAGIMTGSFELVYEYLKWQCYKT
jgi:hypothetical protein